MTDNGKVRTVMPRSAAAKLAMKMLAAVRSLGNRQITTMVNPFPIRDKNPVIKEKKVNETDASA